MPFRYELAVFLKKTNISTFYEEAVRLRVFLLAPNCSSNTKIGGFFYKIKGLGPYGCRLEDA